MGRSRKKLTGDELEQLTPSQKRAYIIEEYITGRNRMELTEKETEAPAFFLKDYTGGMLDHYNYSVNNVYVGERLGYLLWYVILNLQHHIGMTEFATNYMHTDVENVYQTILVIDNAESEASRQKIFEFNGLLREMREKYHKELHYITSGLISIPKNDLGLTSQTTYEKLRDICFDLYDFEVNGKSIGSYFTELSEAENGEGSGTSIARLEGVHSVFRNGLYVDIIFSTRIVHTPLHKLVGYAEKE